MPGRSFAAEQKIRAGTVLARLGVQCIQAGFPITGETDREVTRRLSERTDTAISALARARVEDVDAALVANADIVDIFLPISDGQLEHILGTNRETAMEKLAEAVDQARDGGMNVHVTLADAFRTEVDAVRTVFDTFPKVEYVTLADTVGARTPTTVRSYLHELQREVDLDRVGAHFHDDLGVATANVLAAYELGVGKVDVSVASLGERAGNPALEEVVVAGVTEYDDAFGIDEHELVPACREVLEALDEDVEGRKAILGDEVTEHESGIHTAAMLDDPSVFESFDPERFGGERRLLFGAGTGRTGARKLLERAGIRPTDEQLAEFADMLSRRGPLETDAAISLARSTFGDG